MYLNLILQTCFKNIIVLLFGGIIFLSSCDDRFEDFSYDILYFTSYVDTLASGAQSRGGSVSDSLSHIVTALDDGIGKLCICILNTRMAFFPFLLTVMQRLSLLRVGPVEVATSCMTASVSPPTRTPIPGVKAKLPTTSTMPLPASPAAAISFPPPIIGPVLHTR